MWFCFENFKVTQYTKNLSLQVLSDLPVQGVSDYKCWEDSNQGTGTSIGLSDSYKVDILLFATVSDQ